MKRGFPFSETKPAGSAAQPVSPALSSSERPGSSGRAAQPGGSAAQPVSPALSGAERPGSSGRAAQPAANRSQPSASLNSIAAVDSWLKANAAAVGSSVEAMRIKDVVNVLKVRPRPRKEDVQPFFNIWDVKQKMKQKPKPLPECIQELLTKVVEAAGRLQTDFPSVASRAEQPGTSSAQTDFPSVASRAERPGTSSAVPPFDIHLASQRRRNLCEKIFYEPQSRNKAKDETEPVHRRVFGVLQDCRKYRDNN